MMDCGGAINAVSASPDQRHVVVGGRDVLKTLSLNEDGVWKESKNLRIGRKKGLDLATTDVKWHPLHSHIIASGSTNGTVLTWDIVKPKQTSAQENQFRHSRTVNRVNWHPTEAHWLITGSQDGYIRLWDARCPPGSSTAFSYRYDAGLAASLASFTIPEGGAAFHPSAEAVRDVQFNPFQPFIFAAALEDGGIQLWDIREPRLPVDRFTAHAGLSMCCQWHPTQPDVLATGGRDRLVRIWQTGPGAKSYAADVAQHSDATQINALSRSMHSTVQPIAVIQTIASVAQLCWRPVVPVDTHIDVPAAATHSFGATKHISTPEASSSDGSVFQLATCAALLDNNCYVWDVRHSFLPVAVFSGHRDVVTGMAWLPWQKSTGSWLLSTSKDGKAIFHDPRAALRPHANLRTVSLALSPTEVAWCTQPIQRDAYWEKSCHSAKTAVCKSGLATSRKKPVFHVFNTHPQIVQLLPLDDTPKLVKKAAHFATQMLRSEIADLYDSLDPPAHVFALLALQYATEGAHVSVLCNHNADVAISLGLHRIAQVWRALGILFADVVDSISIQPPALVREMTEASEKRRAECEFHEPAPADSSVSKEEDGVEAMQTMGPSLIPVTPQITGIIPGYITGLLESLSAVNPSIATALLLEDDIESVVSAEEGETYSAQRPTADGKTMIDSEPSTKHADGQLPAGATVGDAAVSHNLLDPASYVEASWRAFRVEVAVNVLEYYADLADVQTCVTVARVLGEDVEKAIGRKRLQRWSFSYIELLHRLQLWSPASTVMARNSDEGIRRLNQLHTNVTVACTSCSKDAVSAPPVDILPGRDDFEIDDAPSVVFASDGTKTLAIVDSSRAGAEDLALTKSAACNGVLDTSEVGDFQSVAASKCGDCQYGLSTCCICLQPVRGVYAWCQGCGHGGHLEHLLDWFANTSAFCPTGCMHVCNLQVGAGKATCLINVEDV